MIFRTLQGGRGMGEFRGWGRGMQPFCLHRMISCLPDISLIEWSFSGMHTLNVRSCLCFLGLTFWTTSWRFPLKLWGNRCTRTSHLILTKSSSIHKHRYACLDPMSRYMFSTLGVWMCLIFCNSIGVLWMGSHTTPYCIVGEVWLIDCYVGEGIMSCARMVRLL